MYIYTVYIYVLRLMFTLYKFVVYTYVRTSCHVLLYGMFVDNVSENERNPWLCIENVTMALVTTVYNYS